VSKPTPVSIRTALAGALGSADPQLNTSSGEPFSTSALGFPTRVFATSTKICTSGGSSEVHTKPSAPPPRPSYTSDASCCAATLIADGAVSVARCSAIHFRDELIRQVSCYTLLSGFRLPWPPSCCLDEPTPFMVSHERTLRHLNRAFGSSHIASSAYQKWPTRSAHSVK
jgi:hypothetical protein